MVRMRRAMRYMGWTLDGGDVVGLDVLDDLTQGVNAFLHGVGQTVMRCANVVSHVLGSGQSGPRPGRWQSCARWATTPQRHCRRPHDGCVTHGEGRNHRRVQAA